MTRKVLIGFALQRLSQKIVLGAGLEPASLSAYAPQTYVSAIPPPERSRGSKLSADGNGWQVSTVFFSLMLLLAGITTTDLKQLPVPMKSL